MTASNASATPMPPPGMQAVTCARCGARYLDNDLGRQAHVAVFSHQPRQEQEDR